MKVLKTQLALGAEHHLFTPTSDRQYPLGWEIQVEDPSTLAITKYMYVKAPAGGMTAYVPYQLSYSSTSGAEIITKVAAAVATPGGNIVCPQVDFTANYYGFVVVEGFCKGLLTAESYTAGDFLKVADSGTAFQESGSAGSSPFTTNTCAMTMTTGTTAVAQNIVLLRGKIVIA